MEDETIPKEVSRGSVTLAPGLTIEAVLLDNGKTVIPEESFMDFINWLEAGNTIDAEAVEAMVFARKCAPAGSTGE